MMKKLSILGFLGVFKHCNHLAALCHPFTAFDCFESNSVGTFGEDASFIFDNEDFSVFSIANGVESEKRQEIESEIFSYNLEKNILDQLKAGKDASSLLNLTNSSLNKIKSDDIDGSSTLRIHPRSLENRPTRVHKLCAPVMADCARF